MGRDSAIEWCHHTFNPWIGCTKVSPGCANCYAEARDQRFNGGKHWGSGAPRRVTSPGNWREPLKWNRRAAKAGVRYRVFCGSLCDVFDPLSPYGAMDWLWALIDATPSLDWLLLTKRPMLYWPSHGFPPNVWIGTTVESPDQLHRVDDLLKIPARVRFLSVEPMLGPVDLSVALPPTWGRRSDGKWGCDTCCHGDRCDEPAHVHRSSCTVCKNGAVERIDWVICGGESGPKARPMHPDWARSLRDQCAAAGVPFLFKQQGEWAPTIGKLGRGELRRVPNGAGTSTMMRRVGKKAAGRLLDGVEHTAFPQGGP